MADFDFSPRGLLYVVACRYLALVMGIRFLLTGLVFGAVGDFVMDLLCGPEVSRFVVSEIERREGLS